MLFLLTKESFVGGQSAYQLDGGSYSTDAGKNDIRAIYDQENIEIKFFWRYQRDINFFDKKLMAFATKHGIDTKPYTASSEYWTATTWLDVSKKKSPARARLWIQIGYYFSFNTKVKYISPGSASFIREAWTLYPQ